MPRLPRFLPLLVLALAGCMEGTKPSGALVKREPTLYERLGGEAGITRAVDDFFAESEHRKRWPEDAAACIKRRLVERIDAATGGPRKAEGKDLGLDDREAAALVAAFRAGDRERKELLELLAPPKGEGAER